MKDPNWRKTAKVGDKLSAKALKTLARCRPPETVQAKTVEKADEGHFGQWFCIDCGEALQNNMQMQFHTKSHRVAWWTGTQCEEP